MKIAVAVPVGLVFGLALGTVAGKMMHKAPPAAEAGADSTATTPPAGEAPPSSAPPTVAEAHDGPPATGDSGAAPVTAAPAAVPGAAETQRLAKMLDRLQATDAVALVTSWSDVELEAVLRAMQVDKSAELIAALPKPRAATLSRRLLAPAGTP